MLLGASPPAATFVPFEAVPSPFDDCAGLLMDSEPPYACRRVATFPMVNRHAPKPSNLKYRSLSESTDLHKLTLTSYTNSDGFTLTDFKRELHMLLEEDQHQQGHQQQQTQKECEGGNEGPSSPTAISEDEANGEKRLMKKSRKKVAFADDRGLQLTTVRFMTEPSDVPPKINPAVIRALLGDQWAEEEEAKAGATWIINFKQPASEYIAFRQKLDSSFVSVENVLVKNDQCRLVGTVKVKNVSFEKEVFIRLTENEWKSYFDRPCKYLANRCGDAYDTFQFDFEIPKDDASHQRIEFCVCFKAGSQEYWDSSDGKNYEIISELLRLQRTQTQSPSNGSPLNEEKEKGRNGLYGKPVVDALTLNCSNWTEFASWSDLSTQGPYW